MTYTGRVVRIFQAHCLDCHRSGEIGPFSMEDYDEIAGWAEMIREVVEQERMPPWFASAAHGSFSNDTRLTEDEKTAILDWVEAGAPFGDPAELPQLKEYAEGWNIGDPDLVVPMADEAFHVPADGVIPYKYYTVDLQFTEDKWMTACEVRPGNRAVVHHVLVFWRVPASGCCCKRSTVA